MKERLLTFALALGAFAAFYVLLAPKVGPPEERTTRPVTTEAGPNGYMALARWLEAEQIKTLSMRERYGSLSQVTGTQVPTGNLLLSTMPQLYPIRSSEVAPLYEWIAKGNTLLVVAGLSDTPDWSMGEGADGKFMENMQQMTGLTFKQVYGPGTASATDEPEREGSEPAKQSELSVQDMAAAMRKLTEPQRFEMKPKAAHPLLESVSTVGALSEFPTGKWLATSASTASEFLELAHDPVSGAPVLWLLPYAEGQIIVSGYASIFTNKMLGGDDNAQLLANLVRWSLGPGGQVLIDDAHQGLVSFYDPEAFFGDSRLHRSIWWLLGLWLVFVLGAQRLRPALSSWHPVDITSFVRATGGFMARVLKPAVAGRQLFANFFNELRRRIGLPLNGAPVWDWLSAHGAVAARDIEKLQDLHARVLHGRRIDLSQLQNLLVQVRAASIK